MRPGMTRLFATRLSEVRSHLGTRARRRPGASGGTNEVARVPPRGERRHERSSGCRAKERVSCRLAGIGESVLHYSKPNAGAAPLAEQGLTVLRLAMRPDVSQDYRRTLRSRPASRPIRAPRPMEYPTKGHRLG